MAKKIHGAVRVGDELYVAGDEQKLSKRIGAKDGLTPEDIERLENVGPEAGGPVISGFGARKGRKAAAGEGEDAGEDAGEGDEEGAQELPKVSELADVLANIDDVDAVQDMKASDPRSTARQYYDARIAELSE